MTDNNTDNYKQNVIAPKKYEYPYSKSFMFDGLEYTYRGKTQEEAEAKAKRNLNALKRGKDIPQHRKDRLVLAGITIDPNITVEKYAEKWDELFLKPFVRAENAEKTRYSMLPEERERYLSNLRLYVFPAVGKMKMREVRDEHLIVILNNMSASFKSESSMDKVRWTIRKMFAQAYTSGIISSNPAAELRLPVPQVSKKERTAFEREICEAIDRVAATDPYGSIVRFERNTGVRNGEIEMLRVSDVNLEDKIIHIHRAAKDAKRIEGPTKSKNGDRFIPVFEDYYEELSALCRNRDSDEYLFLRRAPDGTNIKLSEGYMQRSWAKFRIKVMIELGAPVGQKGKIEGLEYDNRNRVRIPKDRELNEWERLYSKLEFYSLRHTYRTELEEAGVLSTVAAAITGHDKETSKTYTHLTTDIVNQTSRKVDRLRSEKSIINNQKENN